ncbi:MAG: Stk1 family PASTA domain-containing Ser/Thr kinase [Oscillospiraceae bacterium]|nr:Stk1 family PASTA domain-containing Ser/Thr kinase [Oscillospiraceae bacterium]
MEKDKYIGMMLDNRYEIMEKVGAGGMAMVYRAKCHRLNRYVAVKILKDEFATDPDFRQRFHAESQAIAMFSHPNIVSVFDVSRSSEMEYIVMELVDGMSLKQYMQKKGVLSWREALHFISQIVRALEHAHSCGIIHRDVKPHNVMVLRDGSVRVTDFGIARVASSQNTLSQEALGSVHYISPEQAKGARVDERTDIYSAGVVLYEMLTGRLPYEGDSPVAVAIQHISSVPASPRELNEAIPEGLEMITMKAMCADMDKRYASATEMLEDLEEFRKNPDINFDYDVKMDSSELLLLEKKNNELKRKAQAEARMSAEPDERREHRAANRRAGKVTILAGVMVVLIFIAGVSYFLWDFFVKDLFAVVDEISVPDLRGYDVDYARDNFPEFEIVVKDYETSGVYAEGVILEQDIQHGAELKTGGQIGVTVSSGTTDTKMPSVIGLTRVEAEAELDKIADEVTFTVKIVNVESTGDENRVLSTSPQEGETIRDGATVTLRISTKAAEETTEMPKVVGLTEAQAVARLEGADLIVKIKYVESDTAPEGEVVFQNYNEGSALAKDTEVTIHVSEGNGEPDVPDTGAIGGNSVSVTIPLPLGEGEVSVEVRLGGVTQFTGTLEKSQGSFTRSFSGTGTQRLEVYFDGIMSYSTELNFDADGN